jgi:hypothetical protein
VLETDEKVPYGDMPEYNSSTPTKTATAQYTFAFAGWDTAVSEVTGDVVYTAIYTEHIRSYTVTWVVGSQTKTTVCEYGSMPTPPSGFEVGKSIVDNGTTYVIDKWNVSTVTSNATYTAEFSFTGSITSKVSKYGGRTGGFDMAKMYDDTILGSSLNGLNFGSATAMRYVQYYGLNFSELQNYRDVKITRFEISVLLSQYSGSKNSYFGCNIATNLNASQSSGANYDTYTDLGDGFKYMANNEDLPSYSSGAVEKVLTSTEFPKALEWINNNLNAVINGLNSPTFGIRVGGYQVYADNLKMTIYFTAKS